MYNCLFEEPWWLDAVAPGAWHEVTVEKGGVIYARLPFVLRRRFGLRMVTMPSLTQTLGPWLRLDSPKYVNRLALEKELMLSLIEKLPKYDIFFQNFHSSITNWLPFYWSGYSQTTRYTYVISNARSLEEIWSCMSDKTRNEIRKAENKHGLRVEEKRDLDALYNLIVATFSRQGKSVPYSRALLERIESACTARGRGQTFICSDGYGKRCAAIYVVWDQKSAYYLLSGSDPKLRNTGALSFLLWHAIKYLHSRTACFDFEGSWVQSIESHFRSFGGNQTPYFNITRANSLGRIYLKARTRFRR